MSYETSSDSKPKNSVSLDSKSKNPEGATGILYIVSTPIGNLEDITLRAIRILSEADIIACEDTRGTGMLLKHHSIPPKRLLSYHSYSGTGRESHIIQALLDGNTVALVSDAGTPGISDPAYWLVKQAIESGITVSPIPGASAMLSALVCSGLPTHHFTYLGFLPVKKGRKTLLEELKNKTHTVVLYESVHRIERTLSDLCDTFWPECPIVLWRELTKKFEQFARGPIGDFVNGTIRYEKKWEFVICI